MAASATFALKAGVWFRRGRLLMVSPDSLAQRARCQAETPLMALFRFPEPALIEPALDEIVNKRLDRRGILRRTLDQAERMLITLGVDPNRRDQDQILGQMDAVNLDHQQIEAGEIGRHPRLHARR